MTKISAGLLMYRFRNKRTDKELWKKSKDKPDKKLEIFLVHPGGPFWKNKDQGAWSIPKGEISDDEKISEESLLEEAKREFYEETGIEISDEKFIYLGKIKQKSSKIVYAWAFEKNWRGFLRQNFITIDFYGKKMKIPEVDKAKYFSVENAKQKINSAQKGFIDRLIERLEN